MVNLYKTQIKLSKETLIFSIPRHSYPSLYNNMLAYTPSPTDREDEEVVDDNDDVI